MQKKARVFLEYLILVVLSLLTVIRFPALVNTESGLWYSNSLVPLFVAVGAFVLYRAVIKTENFKERHISFRLKPDLRYINNLR